MLWHESGGTDVHFFHLHDTKTSLNKNAVYAMEPYNGIYWRKRRQLDCITKNLLCVGFKKYHFLADP